MILLFRKRPQRKLRWFQFRVRSLLGLIVLSSLVLAALSSCVMPYWAEQRVIAEIEPDGTLFT